MNGKWIAGLVLLAGSVQGEECCHDPFWPGDPLQENRFSPSYNLSAAVATDFFFDVSYTYWYAGEDGLDFGRNGMFISGDDPFFTSSTNILSQSFEYASGFKVGLGGRIEGWELAGEYTWVRNTTSQTSAAPLTGAVGTGVWLIAPWFLQTALDGGTLSGTQVSSQWHLGMDIADLTVRRPCYQGARFTLAPFGGLRAAWIRQKMEINLEETPDSVMTYPLQPIHSATGSHSWSIGPRFGLDADCLLGAGFRLEGDLSFALLFTDYTNIYHTEDTADLSNPFTGLNIQTSKTALRPAFESGLGIGWGTYSYCGKYYFDLSAQYDFMFWWDQNMMRYMLNGVWSNSFTGGDLYLHGLTLKAQFSF